MNNTLKNRHKNKIKSKQRKIIQQEIDDTTFEEDVENITKNDKRKKGKVPSMSQRETKHAVKTRQAIKHGFAVLMQNINFDDITVLDICEKVQITRATFYKYYEDKYHLVICLLNDSCESLFKNSGYGDKDKSTREVYIEVLKRLLFYMEAHREGFSRFFKVGCNEKLRAMVMNKISSLLEDVLIDDELTKALNIPVELISNFITGGFSQILMYIFQNDKSYDVEEVISWANKIFDKLFCEAN